MGDTGDDWEIVEESPMYSEKRESKAAWILDKGLNIGKKIIITGVVISSAPLVLPPLVIISALGFVFSLPSGILLSSYACTEKLMSKLLPIEETNEELTDEYYEKNIEEKGDYEEHVGKFLETRGIEEELTKGAKEEETSDRVGVTEDVEVENKGVEERESSEKTATPETERKGDIQETKNEEKAEEKVEEKDGGVTVVAEKTIINGTDKKAARKRKGNKKQNGGAEQEVEKKKKEEEKAVSSANAAAKDTPDKAPEGAVDLRSSPGVPESKQAAATPTGKEVGPGEEKIWEKLDALRAIVGYKGSPHNTCVGELRALYTFTGIEPPASLLKDSDSDLVEVNDKLGSLMLIVGVK